MTGGATGVLPAELLPEAAGVWLRAEAHAWAVSDPLIPAMVLRRVATLLGAGDRYGAACGATPATGALANAVEHWPGSPDLTPTQRTVLMCTEQFVMDVAGTTPAQRSALADALGPELVPFVQGLYVVEYGCRLRMAASALFAEPLGIADPEATSGPTVADLGPSDGGSPGPWPDLEVFLQVVAALDALDPVTTELVRLRGARQHGCRICMSRRSADALEAVEDPEIFERGAGPEESHTVALALVDAVITQPAAISDDLISAVRRYWNPMEVAEMLLDVTRNAANKPAVALGVDAAAVEDGVELFRTDAAGNVVVVAPE